MKRRQWTDKHQQVREENKKEIKSLFSTQVLYIQKGVNSI